MKKMVRFRDEKHATFWRFILVIPKMGQLTRQALILSVTGIGKIADETGGEYFALGYQNAVSFKPYLDRLQSLRQPVLPCL